MERNFTPSSRRWRTWLAPLAAAAAALLVSACGGGGGSSGGFDDNPGRESFSSGRISGFGSIIVNGVRYDDSGADVLDDEGGRRNRGTLELGMVVDIRSGAVDDSTASATASQIVVVSEIKGPVESIGAGSLTVLSQTIVVDSSTVFDDMPGGLAALSVGNLVEVYAFFDRSTGSFSATRIEKKTVLDTYKLRGLVADLTATTFRLGDAVIDYGSATEVPTLANGLFVKVKLATTPQIDGSWTATKVETGDRRLDDVAGAAEAELSGLVSDFSSLASFKVGGIPVDASGASVTFLRGTADGVVDGAHVEVEGTVAGGVLVARKVKFEDGEDGGDDNGGEREVELHGAAESLDTTAQTFVVRGVTVHYGNATEFRDGLTGATLAGKQLEVKGQLAASGTMIEAERIKLDD